jgi:hypothetical protein
MRFYVDPGRHTDIFGSDARILVDAIDTTVSLHDAAEFVPSTDSAEKMKTLQAISRRAVRAREHDHGQTAQGSANGRVLWLYVLGPEAPPRDRGGCGRVPPTA